MALNAPPGQPTPRWSPPGDQVPDGVWAFDIQRNGWTPPDEPINPDRTQLVMPPGWQPRGRDMPWQVVMSLPGTPAPPGMYNYTPKSREVHQPGAQAPVDETNLSLVPAGGSPSPPGGATAPVPAPSPPGVPPPGGAGMPAPPPPAPPGAPSPPRPPAPGMHPGGGAPPPAGMMPPGPSPTPLGTPPMLRPPQQQQAPVGQGQDHPTDPTQSQSLDPEMIARALLAQLVGVDTTPPAPRNSAKVGVGAAGDDLTELQTQTLQRDARRYEGTPYVLGGNDPTKGIDCSGFVTSLLRGFGARVPGRPTTTTYRDQLAAPTNWDNIRPGDILLSAANPRDPTSGEHMALYVGGGLMAESTAARNERGGNGVRIRSVQGTNLQPYRMREPVPGLSDATLLAQHAAQNPDAAGGNVQLLSAQGAPQTTNPVAQQGRPGGPLASLHPGGGDPEQFFPDANALSIAVGAQHGLPPQLLAGLAANETGNGTAQYTPHNNYFGLTAGSDWQGQTFRSADAPAIPGAGARTPLTFRAYGSALESFDDAARVLTGPRYGDLVERLRQDGNVQAFADGLKARGWATDPAYPGKVVANVNRAQQYLPQGEQRLAQMGVDPSRATQQPAAQQAPPSITDQIWAAAQQVAGALGPRTAYAAEENAAPAPAPAAAGPGSNPLAGFSQAVGGVAQAAGNYVHGQIGANESAEDARARQAAAAAGPRYGGPDNRPWPTVDPAAAPAAAAAAPSPEIAASPAVAPAAAAAAIAGPASGDFAYNTPEQRAPGTTGQSYLPTRPPGSATVATDPRANVPAREAPPGYHWDNDVQQVIPDQAGVYPLPGGGGSGYFNPTTKQWQPISPNERSTELHGIQVGEGMRVVQDPTTGSSMLYADGADGSTRAIPITPGAPPPAADDPGWTTVRGPQQTPITPYQGASLAETRQAREATLAQESARLAEQIRTTDLSDSRARAELQQRMQEHADALKQTQADRAQQQAQYEGVSGNTRFQAGVPRQVGGRLVSYQPSPDDPSQMTSVDMGEVTPTPGEQESARQFDVSRSTLSAADTARLRQPQAIGGGIFQYNPDSNDLSQIGNVPVSPDAQASLDERKFEFGNLSAEQQATIGQRQYEFSNLSAEQSASLGQRQQESSQRHEEALLPYEQMTKQQQAQNQIDQQRLGLQQQQFGLDTQKAQNQLEPLPRGGIARVNPFTGAMQMVNAPEPEAEQYMGGYFYTPAGRTVNIGGQTVSGGPNPYAAWTPSQAGYGSWAPPQMQQQSAMQMSGMQNWRPPQPQSMQGWGAPQQQGWGGGTGGFGGY